jgi:hypothetical protein
MKRFLPHLLVLGAYVTLWGTIQFDFVNDPSAMIRFLDRVVARSLVAFEQPLLWVAGVLLGLFLSRHRVLSIALAGAGAAIGLYAGWQAYGGLSGLTAARLAGDIMTALVIGYGVNAAALLRSGR